MARKAQQCGIPGCKNKRFSRKVCQTCLREITDGGPEYEAECVRLGYMDPPGKRGRPRSSKVKAALKVG